MIKMKRTCMIKVMLVFAVTMLVGMIFSGQKASASYLTRQDVTQLFFNFDSDTYTVSANDVITLNANTNIPADAVSMEYIITSECAQVDSYAENFNQVHIRGVSAGNAGIIAEARVKYYNEDGTEAVYVIVARAEITVLPGAEYISEQNVQRAIGSGAYSLSIVNFHEGKIEWSSSNPNVASVDADGTVMPVSAGHTDITAVLTRSTGQKDSFTCSFSVTNPVISISKTNLAKNANMNITVGGTTGEAQWSSSDAGIATVYGNSAAMQAPGAIITANRVGVAVISVNIDGITLNCTVTVTDPKIEKDFYVVKKNTKHTVIITGLNADSRVSYSTSNSRVATVSETGVITTHAIGYAAIVAKVDNTDLTVSINVGKKKAVKAVMNALKAEGATYSQAKRMQKGYYDCSSLVWRSYSPVKIYFGDKHYAPVAANEAKYLAKHKKTVAVKNINKLNKLRPGDLIFFKGSKNKRYKNITHVAIYMGQQGESYEGRIYTYGKIIHANGTKVAQSYIYNQSNVVVIGRPAK